MKQIIKVESYVTLKIKGKFSQNYKLFENRTDLEVQESSYNPYKIYSSVKVKQISYQTWDDENEKWVLLPNPQQPKIEGISFNEEGEF